MPSAMSLRNKVRRPGRGCKRRADAAVEAQVELAKPFPSKLDVGRGSVLWLEGSRTGRAKRGGGVRLIAGDRSEAALASGMPRPETISSGDWWWAMLPIERSDDEQTIAVEIELAAGFRRRTRRQLGTITVAPDAEHGRQTELALTRPPLGSIMGFPELRPTIAICLATHNPDVVRLEQQIKSLRDQTYGNFRCVISDDASDASHLAEIERVIAGDERFELHTNAEQLGEYGNLERVLTLAPATAPYLALADQDDRWYPHKLEVLLSAFETDTLLIHSDFLRVEGERAVLDEAPGGRADNRDCASLRSLLLRNSASGGASMFRRELLTYALPLPPARGECRADHWLALVARALGGVRFLDTPLYDQVEDAAIDNTEGDPAPALERQPGRIRSLWRRGEEDRPRPNWRRDYFDHAAWGLVASEVLRVRCWGLMRKGDRRELERFSRSVRGERFLPTIAGLMIRSGRRKASADPTTRHYGRAIIWRRAARLRARFVRSQEA